MERRIEIEVVNSNYNEEYKQISLAVPFSQIDSLRLTAYLLLNISRTSDSTSFNKILERLQNNERYLIVTSPFFFVGESKEYFLPVNPGFFKYFFNKDELDPKKIKSIKYFPVLNKEHYNKDFIEKIGEGNKYKFEKGPFFRVKNIIDRANAMSIGVYTVENYYVDPFRFMILTDDEELSEKIKNSLFYRGDDSIHFLGKRISIGFGKVRFRHDNRFYEELSKLNKQFVGEVKANKPYYLFNRIPVDEEILSHLDLENSSYELVKISGYFVKDVELVGRNMFCFKEGSILVFKDNFKLKNGVYRLSRLESKKEYFLPYRPALIEMEDGGVKNGAQN
jgi:hypothetical protein